MDRVEPYSAVSFALVVLCSVHEQHDVVAFMPLELLVFQTDEWTISVGTGLAGYRYHRCVVCVPFR